MTHPETPAPMTDVGPRYTTPTCRGCPAFKEERWSEPSGDGETMDSGEQQTCLAANREIATYGSVAVHPPHWCPGIHRSSPSTAAGGWQAIEEYKRDGTVIQRQHVMFNAPISVRWVSDKDAFIYDGQKLNWVEASYAHAWPEAAFTPHFRPLPEPPK